MLRRVLLLSNQSTSPEETAVFNNLIESNRKTDKKGAFGLGFVSLIGHSVIVLAAVVATLTAGEKKDAGTVDTAMVFLNQEQQKKPEEQPPVVDVPQLKGFQTVVAPTDIPTNIPPINLQQHFDPKDYTGTGVEGGIGMGIAPDQVFSESVVEERPEVLSGPALNYPDLLRQAGVQGRVLVQAIIDTSGRAEPPSVKVIQSPNPGFDQPAKNYVLRALFRPARVHGRAVRVLVNLPIDFKIKR
jgi:protein TonB